MGAGKQDRRGRRGPRHEIERCPERAVRKFGRHIKPQGRGGFAHSHYGLGTGRKVKAFPVQRVKISPPDTRMFTTDLPSLAFMR